jgi:hypothetical protein
MKSRRMYLLGVMLIGAALTASCSSDTITGGVGTKQLAQILDSAFRADSLAGLHFAPKSIAEEEVAYLADRGLQPVIVTVTTENGPLAMWMLAGTSVDTNATGAIADSLSVVYGWTPDYQTWLIFVTEQYAGNGVPVAMPAGSLRTLSPTHPFASSARTLARTLAASIAQPNLPRTHATVAIDSLGGAWIGFLWQHGTTISQDSAAGIVSWYEAPGGCAWLGVPLSRFKSDSASACTRATYNVQLSLRNTGTIPSLTEVTLPAQPIPAMRFVDVNF